MKRETIYITWKGVGMVDSLVFKMLIDLIIANILRQFFFNSIMTLNMYKLLTKITTISIWKIDSHSLNSNVVVDPFFVMSENFHLVFVEDILCPPQSPLDTWYHSNNNRLCGIYYLSAMVYVTHTCDPDMRTCQSMETRTCQEKSPAQQIQIKSPYWSSIQQSSHR